MVRPRRVGRRLPARVGPADQQGVDSVGDLQVPLQAAQGDENGPYRTLPGAQRKLAHAGGLEDAADRKAQGSPHPVAAAVQGVARHIGGLLQPQEHRAAGLGPQVSGGLRAEQDPTARPRAGTEVRIGLHALKSPESFIHSIDRNTGGAQPCLGLGQPALLNQEGAHGAELPGEIRMGGHLPGEGLPEENAGGNHPVGGAQPLQRQPPQASAHGISNQQRTGQDRHGHGHPDHHRQVGAPVVGQAASASGGWRTF